MWTRPNGVFKVKNANEIVALTICYSEPGVSVAAVKARTLLQCAGSLNLSRLGKFPFPKFSP